MTCRNRKLAGHICDANVIVGITGTAETLLLRHMDQHLFQHLPNFQFGEIVDVLKRLAGTAAAAPSSVDPPGEIANRKAATSTDLSA